VGEDKEPKKKERSGGSIKKRLSIGYGFSSLRKRNPIKGIPPDYYFYSFDFDGFVSSTRLLLVVSSSIIFFLILLVVAHRRVRGGRQEEGARYMLALSPPRCNFVFYLFICLCCVGAGQVHRNQGGRRGMEANQARGTGGSSTAQVRSPPMRHCALFRFVCVCACVVSLSVCVCRQRACVSSYE
jgi:hypothetical protein